MKKIITTLALAAAFGFAANAQRTIDVSTFIVYDEDSIVDVNCEENVKFQFGFINNGPDEIQATDKYVQGDLRSDFTETPSGPSISVTGPYNSETVIGVGDTLGFFQYDFPVDAIKFLFPINPDGTLGSVVYPPFANGIYAGLIYFGKFGDVSGSSWVPSTEITDPNDTNNVNYVILRFDCAEDPSSIGSAQLGQSINVYPNPSTGIINFSFDMKANESAIVRIYDITGRMVLNKDLGNQTAGNKNFSLDASNLPNGNYSLEVSTDSQKGYSKFVITK